MPTHFEVIGEDDELEGADWSDYDDVHGAVMGDYEDVEGAVMGYAGPMGDYEGSAIVGYDEYGEPIVGARRRRRRRSRHHHRRSRTPVIVRRPGWRAGQLAPGVIAPDQGLLPLPLTGQPSNTFTSVLNTITFEGQIQKPFRGERLLVSVVRTGDTAVGRLISQLFVGTDLQQLDVPGFDAEQVGDPAAFGVRLTMKPAQPGVFIRLVTTLSAALTSPDTIYATVTLLGRNVH
jgi:hypothetical protein